MTLRFSCKHAGKLLLSVIMLVCGTSVRADTKVFPATICEIWGGDRHLARYISHSQFGKISNTHPTKKISVVCPLVRDRPDRPMDVSLYWTDAYLANDGAVGELKCRFRANTLWGNSSYASSAANSANWGDASPFVNQQGIVESLRGRFWWNNLTGLNSATADAYNTSTYTVLCSIPPLYMGNESYLGTLVIEED